MSFVSIVFAFFFAFIFVSFCSVSFSSFPFCRLLFFWCFSYLFLSFFLCFFAVLFPLFPLFGEASRPFHFIADSEQALLASGRAVLRGVTDDA